MSTKHQVVRVQFSAVEDCRRVVFDILVESGLSECKARRMAGVISARLRDTGHLGSSLEQHYSAADAAALMGGRCSAWAVKHARMGDFGPVSCDGGDWLIPASGLQAYLARFSVDNVKVMGKKCVGMVEVAGEKNLKGSVPISALARGGHGPTDTEGVGIRDHVIDGESITGPCISGDVVERQPGALQTQAASR